MLFYQTLKFRSLSSYDGLLLQSYFICSAAADVFCILYIASVLPLLEFFVMFNIQNLIAHESSLMQFEWLLW